MSERLLDDKEAGSHTGSRAVSHITFRKQREATKVPKEIKKAIKQEPIEFAESKQKAQLDTDDDDEGITAPAPKAKSALRSQASKGVLSHHSKTSEEMRAIKNELAKMELLESFDKEKELIEQKKLELARDTEQRKLELARETEQRDRNFERELKESNQRKEKAILQAKLKELKNKSNASRLGSKGPN